MFPDFTPQEEAWILHAILVQWKKEEASAERIQRKFQEDVNPESSLAERLSLARQIWNKIEISRLVKDKK